MTEHEVCASCRDPEMSRKFCAILTQGNPNDSFCIEMTQRADRKAISDEEFFGILVNHYGEAAVSNAVMAIMKEYGTAKPKTKEVQPVAKPTPTVAQTPTPPPPPAEKGKSEEKKNKGGGFHLVGKSDIKDLCSGCVGPSLLGAGITMTSWFRGKDKEYMVGLCDKLEKGEIAVEDFIKETFVKWGIDALRSWNRIFDDINIVFIVAKDKAIEERPDLKDIPLDEWGDAPPEPKTEKKEEKKEDKKKVEQKPQKKEEKAKK